MKFLKGLLVFLAQSVLTLGLFWAFSQTLWLAQSWIYVALSWGMMPLCGLFSAYYARKFGVSNYLAWIAPPLCVFFSHYLATFYTPTGTGPTFLTAFFSIVGAAAAEVRRMRRKDR